MTHRIGLSRFVIKEVRALFPTWLACMLALGVAGGVGDSTFQDSDLGLLIFILGSLVLGAQSMGREYTDRTLPLLLSQPVDRWRLFLIKQAVLASMLLSYAVLALRLFGDALPDPESGFAALYLLLVPLCGLFVTPYVTMQCRSALAGVVLSPVPLGLWLIGQNVVDAWHGPLTVEMEQLRFPIVWSGMLLVCVAGAIATWRLFMRLEAIEGHGPAWRLPSWLRLSTPSFASARIAPEPRHPIWLLARKELHLQQITLGAAVVAIVVLLAVGTLMKLQISDPFESDATFALAMIYAAIFALLAGSLASAEERRLGTLESQVLLPVAAWKQWALKASVAVGLALLLAILLPILLARGLIGMGPWEMGMIVLLATGSLYVSSLCASGLSAFVWSAVAIVVLVTAQIQISPWLPPSMLWVMAALLAGPIVQFIWFGFVNHRTADRSGWRVVRQVVWMAGYQAMAIACWVAATLVIYPPSPW